MAGVQSPGSLVLADGASNLLSPGLQPQLTSQASLQSKAPPVASHPPSAQEPASPFLILAAGGPRRGWSSEPRCLSGVGEAQLDGQVWGGPEQLQGVWKAFGQLMSMGSN